jgi:hypothetical protein
MLSIFALSWSLTFGYNPASLGADQPSPYRSDAFYSCDLALSLSAFDHLRFYTDWESFATKNEGHNLFFAPYRIDYSVGFALYAKGIELGIRHECDHPVVFSRSQRFDYSSLSSDTSLYLRFSGSTK